MHFVVAYEGVCHMKPEQVELKKSSNCILISLSVSLVVHFLALISLFTY